MLVLAKVSMGLTPTLEQLPQSKMVDWYQCFRACMYSHTKSYKRRTLGIKPPTPRTQMPTSAPVKILVPQLCPGSQKMLAPPLNCKLYITNSLGGFYSSTYRGTMLSFHFCCSFKTESLSTSTQSLKSSSHDWIV